MDTMKNTMATEGQRKRREAQQQLAGEVERLMSHDEQEGLQWKGTHTDLMEALHVAYETGALQDEWGICLSFSSIVRRVCRLLHVNEPRNPYECASRGQRRKGMQMTPYLERYQRLRAQGVRNPLWKSIKP